MFWVSNVFWRMVRTAAALYLLTIMQLGATSESPPRPGPLPGIVVCSLMLFNRYPIVIYIGLGSAIEHVA